MTLLEKLMWIVRIDIRCCIGLTAKLCTTRKISHATCARGHQAKYVLTHVDSDWAGSTDRCSTSSGVELHGRRPLDVGIMFGQHIVDRAQLHGTQEKQNWLGF